MSSVWRHQALVVQTCVTRAVGELGLELRLVLGRASLHDWSSLNNNSLHALDGAKVPDLLECGGGVSWALHVGTQDMRAGRFSKPTVLLPRDLQKSIYVCLLCYLVVAVKK